VRILDRYVLREFLGYLALGMITFLGIFIVVDVFEKVDTFVDGEAPVALVARFYLYYAPWVAVQVLPVAMLLASLMALGRLVRQHELTAMLMAGMSLARAYGAVLVFGMLVSIGAFALEQGVVPEANYQRRIILQHDIKKKPRPSSRRERDVLYVGRGGRIYTIGSYDPERALMRDVIIEEREQNVVTRRIDAQLGRWIDDHWELTGVTIRTFDGDRLDEEQRSTLELDVPERPRDFARVEREPEEMGWRALGALIERRRLSGSPVTQQIVDWHMKFAFPLINFIVVLIGAALSTRIRRGGMAVGFGLSLLISFIYYCGLRAGQALGHGGALPPVVAAWIANLLFGGVALVLFLRAQRGR
jgi:lipopolysaccharide export system permease protein